MSIRLRLAAVFTLVTVVLLGLGGYLYAHQLRANLQYSLDRSLEVQEGAISLTVSGTGHLPRRIDNYAQILSVTGTVLVSSRSVRVDQLLTPAEVRRAAAGHPVRADRTLALHNFDDVDPEQMRIYAKRLAVDGPIVAVAARRDLIDNPVSNSIELLILLGIIAVVVVAPGSWLLARAALRPVERMRSQVARLDPGSGVTGVPVPNSRDEIARLGHTFNDLLGRVSAALARERAFVADAGHELRTPLTVLKGEFELAQRAERSREALLTTIGIGADETERLIRLTENLLGLARGGTVRQAPFDAADLAHAAAAGSGAAGRGVRVEIRDESGGVFYGDADRLRQAVDNLLSNALRYSTQGSVITLVLARRDRDAVIEVVDQGPGFPPEFIPIAFDRFTRADDARSRTDGGNGLGLAVVAAVMGAHGGSAAAANEPGGGARVTLRWRQPGEWGGPLA